MTNDPRPPRNPETNPLDENSLFSGFVYGLLIGALLALLKGPRVNLKTLDLNQAKAQLKTVGQSLRESALPPDPVEKSMAEGKAAARRRRAALGLDKDPKKR